MGINFPQGAGILSGFGGGGICFLSKTQARALIGGFLIAGAGFIVLSGTVMLLGYGLTKVNALNNVQKAIKLAPGVSKASNAPKAVADDNV
jgi:hypothetical protein